MKTTPTSTSRRSFLKTALAAVPAALATGSLVQAQNAAPQPAAGTDPLPTRPLGKSGRPVTMVSMGGMMSALSPEYLDIAWSMGIRYFDTADCYLGGRSEKIIGEWLKKYPERRKEIFLVSKDHPTKGPEQLLEMIDRRLAALGTTYLDAFYIHGIGPKDYGDASLDWPKNDAYKKVVETLKSSGKCKMVGFSCHDGRLVDYLNAAAEGRFVDIIMLRYNPFFKKGEPIDLALTACHKAGIGLVAMKTMRDVKDVPQRLPEFDKLGLTVNDAKLQACWSDPRISAICINIENADQMAASTGAARSYKQPLKLADMEILRETVIAGRRTMCTGCPSCDALSAATEFAFLDIARYVTYYEQDGSLEARSQFHALPASSRDLSGVDLSALRDGCSFKTDYPEIIRRAHRYFA
jgi:predicted aldo/keto reductase-like oxidoreductase